MANICSKPVRLLACVALLGLGIVLTAMYFHAQPSREDLGRICAVGTVDELAAAIAAGADVNSTNEHGDTLLMITALDRTGSAADKAKLLLQANADPTMKNLDGYTALHEAAGKANLDLVKVLVNAGAEVNATSNIGLLALNLACATHHNLEKGRQVAVIHFLLESGTDIHAGVTHSLGIAAAGADSETISLLLGAGYDVNVRNDQGRTPLMNAARFNSNPEVISLLLNAGADISLRDIKGETALENAKQNPNPAADEIIKLIHSAE